MSDYQSGGVDLNVLLAKIYGLPQAATSGYQDGGVDVSTVYGPQFPTGSNGFGVGPGLIDYKVGGTDFGSIYAAANSYTSGNVNLVANNLNNGTQFRYFGMDLNGDVWIPHTFGATTGNTFLGYPVTTLAYEYRTDFGANGTFWIAFGNVPNATANDWANTGGTGINNTGTPNTPFANIEMANTANGQKLLVNYSAATDSTGGRWKGWNATIFRDGNGLTANVIFIHGAMDIAGLGMQESGATNANAIFGGMSNTHTYLAIINQTNATYTY